MNSWEQPEWLVLTALRRHLYVYGDKGSKPSDPGWHVCSCGSWEGYWSGYQPHVAEQIVAALAPSEASA
jgi:hypothetical protein